MFFLFEIFEFNICLIFQNLFIFNSVSTILYTIKLKECLTRIFSCWNLFLKTNTLETYKFIQSYASLINKFGEKHKIFNVFFIFQDVFDRRALTLLKVLFWFFMFFFRNRTDFYQAFKLLVQISLENWLKAWFIDVNLKNTLNIYVFKRYFKNIESRRATFMLVNEVFFRYFDIEKIVPKAKFIFWYLELKHHIDAVGIY